MTPSKPQPPQAEERPTEPVRPAVDAPTEPTAPSQKAWARPPLAADDAVTVSDLTRDIRRDLEGRYRAVLVTGEVSNLQIHHRSGHGYFTLKDESAQLRCMIPRSALARHRFRPRDGIEVLVRGRITVYQRGGQMQMQVEQMEPRGIGALQQAFLDRVEQLSREGLTDPARKQALPLFPRVLGIVTSKGGAALRDILRVARTRDRGLRIIISDARVQGVGSAQSVASAIERLDALGEADVIIVGRGGGSLEDLWAFNEEAVARAIAAARTPIITGVGHETDTTIADLVSDHRASTPTAAAEAAVLDRAELLDRWRGLEGRLHRAQRNLLERLSNRLLSLQTHLKDPEASLRARAQHLDELSLRAERSIKRRLEEERSFLQDLERRLGRQEARAALESWQVRLDLLESRLAHAIELRLSQAHSRFAVAVGQLESLSPLGVLGRGYALIQKRSGQVVRHANDVRPGEDIEITLSRGRLQARILRSQQRPNDD